MAASVTVTWTAAVNASKYQVLRAVAGGSPAVIGADLASSARSYTDESAVPGTLYAYTVKSTGGEGTGDSVASVPAAGWRRNTAPTALTATDGTSSTHVVVTWVASPGASGYKLFRSTGTAAAIQLATTTDTSFNDTTAVPGVTYTYSAKASGQTGTGDSELSTSDSGWRGIVVPTEVSATDGSSTDKVVITWTGASGSTYKIFRAAGADWREPGCSMCLAMNPDKLAVGERSASTSNRNFEGRQGRGGRTHLVSPAVAAATAVAGTFCTPEDLK